MLAISFHPMERSVVEKRRRSSFAVGGLGVKDIVICRHLHCGAMNGLLAPEKLSDLPMVGSWPSYADSTQRIMQENYQHITDGNARPHSDRGRKTYSSNSKIYGRIHRWQRPWLETKSTFTRGFTNSKPVRHCLFAGRKTVHSPRRHVGSRAAQRNMSTISGTFPVTH